jgi:hypothetical protein
MMTIKEKVQATISCKYCGCKEDTVIFKIKTGIDKGVEKILIPPDWYVISQHSFTNYSQYTTCEKCTFTYIDLNDILKKDDNEFDVEKFTE